MSCNDTSTEETTTRTSLCDGDRVDNVWVEGADENGEGGICLLDTLTEQQIIYVIQSDERARQDLYRITTNERLLELAATVPRLPTGVAGDVLQKEMNQNPEHFYRTFRGRPPTAR